MKKIDSAQIQGYLVGQVIAASVGGIMLLTGDFGGFYYRDYYNHIDFYGYVYLGSGVLATVLILLGAGGLFMAFQSSIKSLKAEDASPLVLRENVQKAVKGASFTAALATVGAVALIVGNLGNDWWLDTGFYGAFFGGLLTVFFAKQILKAIED